MEGVLQSERSKRQFAPPECTAPWLLLQQGDDYQDQTFYVLSPLPCHQYYARKRIPELSGNKILGCCYGWLLLMDRFEGSKLCLLNPVTLATILLPPLENETGTFPFCALTAPPEDFNCLVLLFAGDRAIFCRPRRNDRWTVQETRILGSGKEIEIYDLISSDGVIYAGGVSENRRLLVSVEFADDQPEAQLLMTIRSLELEFPCAFNCTFRFLDYLVESCGELFAVGYHINLQDIHRVDVCRLDKDISGNKMTWIEVKSLKNRAFFIGRNCCASLYLKSHESVGILRENSIYFTFKYDEGLYSYGLEDRSFTPFLPCPNLRKVSPQHFWVVPHCHQSSRSDSKLGEDSIGLGNIQSAVMSSISRLEEDIEDSECGTNESVFSALPQDIIALVARRLPLYDYLKFRVVCKRFLKATPKIDWMTASVIFKREDHAHFTPSLLSLDRTNGKLCNLIDRCSIAPALFKGATITFSRKDWLLYYSDDGILQSLNPVTGIGAKYPIDYIPGPTWGFSTFPTSPDCVIVGMQWNGIGSEFLYMRHGDEDWNYYNPLLDSVGNAEVSFEKADNTPVYYEGAFYYLDRKGHLGAFELTENGCSWKIVTKESPCRTSCQENYVVECDGTLLSVFVGRLGKWIQIFRLHRPTMTWEKVESLGKYMVFLSRASSFSTPAISASMENRIYFLRLLGGSPLYYSLDTGKYHSAGCLNPIEDFCNSRQLLQSCWIEPMTV